MTTDWIRVSHQVFDDRLDSCEFRAFDDSLLLEQALELVSGPTFGSQWSDSREVYLED